MTKYERPSTRLLKVAWVIFLSVCFLFLLALYTKADAAELGPNPPVKWLEAGVGGTLLDNGIQPTLHVGYRQSWHPFDVVVEGIIRERGSINLLAARTWGDNRILGGVGLVSGADNAGLVFGVDRGKWKLRLTTYAVTTLIGRAETTRCRRECNPPGPISSTKNNSALTLTYAVWTDAR